MLRVCIIYGVAHDFKDNWPKFTYSFKGISLITEFHVFEKMKYIVFSIESKILLL